MTRERRILWKYSGKSMDITSCQFLIYFWLLSIKMLPLHAELLYLVTVTLWLKHTETMAWNAFPSILSLIWHHFCHMFHAVSLPCSAGYIKTRKVAFWLQSQESRWCLISNLKFHHQIFVSSSVSQEHTYREMPSHRNAISLIKKLTTSRVSGCIVNNHWMGWLYQYCYCYKDTFCHYWPYSSYWHYEPWK